MIKLKDIVNENNDKAKLYKLYTKAMKMMPGSPDQKKIKKEIDKLRKKLGINEKVYNIDMSKNPKVMIGDLYDSLFQFQKKHSKKVLGPKGQKVLKNIVDDMNYLRGLITFGENTEDK